MKKTKMKIKPFSDLDFCLFRTYEANFFFFLYDYQSPIKFLGHEANILKKRVKRQENIVEKGLYDLKTLIFRSLIKKNNDPKKKKLFRTNSATKFDFPKLYQYRLYTSFLKRMKKKAFLNILEIIKEFNYIYNHVWKELERGDLEIYKEKMVSFFKKMILKFIS